jgi:putative acetyltransferase
MINGLTLRPATHADVPEMQCLFSDTVSVLCAKDYNEDQIKVWVSAIDNTERWLDKLDSQYFIIAEIVGKIVGYGSIENSGYLDFMYVHKNYQRQGIARIILKELGKEAVKYGALEIIADVSKTARPFFEKSGFTTIGENINKIKGIEIVNYKMVKKL